MLGSVYTLSAANGMYSDTGLSVTLPSAGTYRLTADVRAEVLVPPGSSAFIEVNITKLDGCGSCVE